MDAVLREVRDAASCVERERRAWEPLWREVADFVLPRCIDGTRKADEAGDTTRRGPRIIDGTATRAVRILAAGMQGGLTSPARPWFRLRLADEDMEEAGPERRWLDVVERRLYAALARSNFYAAVHGLYTELAAFGSADMYHEADPQRVMRFSCLACGDFAWACDAAGRVDTVVRRLRMSARQMAQRYGEAHLSRRVRRMLRRDPERPVPLVHMVRPRVRRAAGEGGKATGGGIGGVNMPWQSLTWEAEAAEGLLHEGGFEEFPHLAARWDVAGGDIYGRSPGMDVLPDVKMLQEMARSQLLAIHKVVNPPMRVPSGFKQRLNLIPGGQNYVTPGQGESVGPLYQINPDIGAVTHKMEDVRRAVREGFFNDLFLMFTAEGRSNITAAEVLERGEEKLLMLGPVIERHQSELLDPLLERTYGILRRGGLLPPPPPELAGRSMRVEYVSALAQAQRVVTAQAIRRFASDVSTLAGVAPQVLDKVDFEQAVDELAAIAGVPARVVRSDAEVAALRAARDGLTGTAIASLLSLPVSPASPGGAECTTTEGVMRGEAAGHAEEDANSMAGEAHAG